MNPKTKLKAQTRQLDNNLLFYSSYWETLQKQGIQKEEFLRRLDVLLDKRLALMKELKG